MANKYTLGRGEIWFAQYAPDTQTPGGERYFGNTPEFNITIESENLDHFNSDRGINEKDDSITLSTNRTGSLITDNIDVNNIALFFFGSVGSFADAGGLVTDEEHDDVVQGTAIQLGISPSNPVGARKLDDSPAPVVDDDTTPTPVTFVEGDDYTVDLEQGRIFIVEGGAIVDGTNLRITYTTLAHSRKRIISGTAAISGAMRYIEYNPKGENKVWYFPYTQISANGDYALKGDEWQQIPFSIEVLKKTGLEAIYIDGTPLLA